MAWLFGDGMGHYTAVADLTKKWSQYQTNSSYLSVTEAVRFSRTGIKMDGAFALTGNFYGLWKNVAPTDPTTCRAGFALRCINNFGSHATPIFGIGIAGIGYQCGLRINTGGTLSVVTGDPYSGSALATSSALSLATWYYIELSVTIDNAGAYDLRINGQTAVSGSGDTMGQTSATYSMVNLRGPYRGSASTINNVVNLCDFYALDGSGSAPLNALLGDVRGDVHLPTDAGAHSEWTPSAGENHECVDDSPGADNGNTDYVSTATLNAIDTYPVADLANPGGTIRMVQLLHAIDKATAGDCQIKAVARVGGTDYPNALTHYPGAGQFAYYATPLPENPAGGAWTEAAFNAAEFGQKKVA